jgi:hypothetical protein
MLQKPSIEQLSELNQSHLFLMDIGICYWATVRWRFWWSGRAWMTDLLNMICIQSLDLLR